MSFNIRAQNQADHFHNAVVVGAGGRRSFDVESITQKEDTYIVEGRYQGRTCKIITQDHRVSDYLRYGKDDGAFYHNVSDWASQTANQLDALFKESDKAGGEAFGKYELEQGTRGSAELKGRFTQETPTHETSTIETTLQVSSSKVSHLVRYGAGALGIGKAQNLDINTGQWLTDKPSPENVAKLTPKELKNADWEQLLYQDGKLRGREGVEDIEFVSQIPLGKINSLPTQEEKVAAMTKLVNVLARHGHLHLLKGMNQELLNLVKVEYLNPQAKNNFLAFKDFFEAKEIVNKNPQDFKKTTNYYKVINYVRAFPECYDQMDYQVWNNTPSIALFNKHKNEIFEAAFKGVKEKLDKNPQAIRDPRVFSVILNYVKMEPDCLREIDRGVWQHCTNSQKDVILPYFV